MLCDRKGQISLSLLTEEQCGAVWEAIRYPETAFRRFLALKHCIQSECGVPVREVRVGCQYSHFTICRYF